MFKQQPIAAAFALAFGASGMVLMTGPAVAQDAQKLERVEITGSAIKRID